MEQGPKIEKREDVYHTELVSGFDEKILDSIVEIENDCFPKEWNLWESEESMREYYTEALKEKESINVVMKDADKIIGYILAIPHNEAKEALFEYDSELKADNERYYIETAGILKSYRGTIRSATSLISAVCEEAKKRGIIKFSCHARKAKRMDEGLKKLLKGMITKSRNIDKWGPAGDEPFEYLEWTYKE